jgi:hypothetical protein
MRLRERTGRWIRRYLPAELAGFAGALMAALTVNRIWPGHLAAVAIAGTIGEALGYYGVFALCEWRRHARSMGQLFRRMVVEFGPAEALDYLVRPLAMYALPELLGNVAVGVIAGKIVADLVFYGWAVTAYETWLTKTQPSTIGTNAPSDEMVGTPAGAGSPSGVSATPR